MGAYHVDVWTYKGLREIDVLTTPDLASCVKAIIDRYFNTPEKRRTYKDATFYLIKGKKYKPVGNLTPEMVGNTMKYVFRSGASVYFADPRTGVGEITDLVKYHLSYNRKGYGATGYSMGDVWTSSVKDLRLAVIRKGLPKDAYPSKVTIFVNTTRLYAVMTKGEDGKWYWSGGSASYGKHLIDRKTGNIGRSLT